MGWRDKNRVTVVPDNRKTEAEVLGSQRILLSHNNLVRLRLMVPNKEGLLEARN
jgi:hypothetical protein